MSLSFYDAATLERGKKQWDDEFLRDQQTENMLDEGDGEVIVFSAKCWDLRIT